MKASELRLGNYVVVKYPYDRRDRIGEISLNELDLMQILAAKSTPNPIPITEEWLGRMGFDGETISINDRWNLTIRFMHAMDYVGCMIYFKHSKSEMSEPWLTPQIKYVHELQNLYFSLTGSELTIKETAKE